jgi:hypothetical protein
MLSAVIPPCPLCAGAARALHEDAARGWRYAACGGCGLAFRWDGTAPSGAAERKHYELHQNRPEPGYEAFLRPAAEALAARCPRGSEGLDYGCGPGPVLALMLGERGLKTSLYDKHFAPSPLALERRYAFVACTETAEHFARPAEEFERLAGLLEPGGWLAVLTKLRVPDEDFARWHYRQDPTHVSFYAERTLEWLAGRHGWALERPARDLALFRRHTAVAQP